MSETGSPMDRYVLGRADPRPAPGRADGARRRLWAIAPVAFGVAILFALLPACAPHLVDSKTAKSTSPSPVAAPVPSTAPPAPAEAPPLIVPRELPRPPAAEPAHRAIVALEQALGRDRSAPGEPSRSEVDPTAVPARATAALDALEALARDPGTDVVLVLSDLERVFTFARYPLVRAPLFDPATARLVALADALARRAPDRAAWVHARLGHFLARLTHSPKRQAEGRALLTRAFEATEALREHAPADAKLAYESLIVLAMLGRVAVAHNRPLDALAYARRSTALAARAGLAPARPFRDRRRDAHRSAIRALHSLGRLDEARAELADHDHLNPGRDDDELAALRLFLAR